MLFQHAPAWRDLLGRSGANEPTRTPLWLGAWWRVFGPLDGRKLRVALLYDGARLVGVVPLLARRAWHAPGVPFRRLELLGTGETEADEICSEHLGPIVERGREEDAGRAIVALLAGGTFGVWDEFVLSSVDAEDATLPPLLAAFERAGISVERTLTGACPYVALPKSFDEYLGSLPGSRRYLVKRSLRDFESWANGTAKLHEVRTPEELERGKRVLEALHAERWKAEGKRGVFASPRFSAFHDEVMEALLEEDALDLSWLSVNDRPIAAAYNVVWNGKAYFYQSGRTLDVPKGVRPGIVLHTYAIRRAIERGLSEYDFLAGTSQYKLDLATHTRGLARIRAVRSSLRERARHLAERGIERLRRLKHGDSAVTE